MKYKEKVLAVGRRRTGQMMVALGLYCKIKNLYEQVQTATAFDAPTQAAFEELREMWRYAPSEMQSKILSEYGQ